MRREWDAQPPEGITCEFDETCVRNPWKLGNLSRIFWESSIRVDERALRRFFLSSSFCRAMAVERFVGRFAVCSISGPRPSEAWKPDAPTLRNTLRNEERANRPRQSSTGARRPDAR